MSRQLLGSTSRTIPGRRGPRPALAVCLLLAAAVGCVSVTAKDTVFLNELRDRRETREASLKPTAPWDKVLAREGLIELAERPGRRRDPAGGSAPRSARFRRGAGTGRAVLPGGAGPSGEVARRGDGLAPRLGRPGHDLAPGAGRLAARPRRPAPQPGPRPTRPDRPVRGKAQGGGWQKALGDHGVVLDERLAGPRPRAVRGLHAGRGCPGLGDAARLPRGRPGRAAGRASEGRAVDVARPARSVPPPRAPDRGDGRDDPVGGLKDRDWRRTPTTLVAPRPVRRPVDQRSGEREVPVAGGPDHAPGDPGRPGAAPDPGVDRPVRFRLQATGRRGGPLPAPTLPAGQDPRGPRPRPVLEPAGLGPDHERAGERPRDRRALPVLGLPLSDRPADPRLGRSSCATRWLKRVRDALDPGHADPSMDRMVLVGHSMGGLLSKMMAQDTGLALWDAAFRRPASDLLKASPETPEDPRRVAHLRAAAVREAGRLHRHAAPGQPDRRPVVRPDHRQPDPPDQRAGRDRAGARRAERPRRDRPRTPRLRPQCDRQPPNRQPDPQARSTEIPIDPKVPYHSIIPLIGGVLPTDGVVEYRSSHLDGAESELIVAGTHFSQQHPDVTAELRRTDFVVPHDKVVVNHHVLDHSWHNRRFDVGSRKLTDRLDGGPLGDDQELDAFRRSDAGGWMRSRSRGCS